MVRMGTYEVNDPPWAAIGIHAKPLWTLHVSFNDGTFGRHYIATCQSMVWDEPGGLGEGRLSTSVGYPLRQDQASSTQRSVWRCVSVTVPALGGRGLTT